jgi:hypothetical protein
MICEFINGVVRGEAKGNSTAIVQKLMKGLFVSEWIFCGNEIWISLDALNELSHFQVTVYCYDLSETFVSKQKTMTNVREMQCVMIETRHIYRPWFDRLILNFIDRDRDISQLWLEQIISNSQWCASCRVPKPMNWKIIKNILDLHLSHLFDNLNKTGQFICR